MRKVPNQRILKSVEKSPDDFNALRDQNQNTNDVMEDDGAFIRAIRLEVTLKLCNCVSQIIELLHSIIEKKAKHLDQINVRLVLGIFSVTAIYNAHKTSWDKNSRQTKQV